MTTTAFKAARNRLGLSAASLGAILNVDPRTIRKWEQEGTVRPPNAIACRVLEWMIGGYRPPQWPLVKT